MSDEDERPRLVVVGGGVAGLTASIFAARNGIDTLVVDGEESILRRNAHLENYPGFPAGVNSRTFLQLTRAQARRNGAAIEDGLVVDVEHVERDGGRDDDGVGENDADGDGENDDEGDDGNDGEFRIVLEDGGEFHADYVIAASWSDASYLDHLDVGIVERGSKRFVQTDRHGRTDVDGLYAAGRIAQQHHQTVVAAGHGAQAALALLEDSEVPFYHDWVAPAGYFTGRGRDVPPGCEEIDEAERQRRERRTLERIQEAFAEPHPEEPTMHPSVVEQRRAEGED